MAQSSENATLPPPSHTYMQRLKKQKKFIHWPVSHAAGQQKACGLSDYWPFINSIKLHRVQIKEEGQKPRLAFHTSHAEAGVLKKLSLAGLAQLSQLWYS